MTRLFSLAAALLAATAAFGAVPATTNNDDTCDIGHAPAATLLLPYFEVDFKSPQATAQTTLFTIQNTSAMPQIARVTLWTDWGYPMLTFNIFLTGYGMQGINLYDVFTRGAVAGGSNQTTPGPRSLRNDQNPAFLPDAASTCSSDPGPLSAALVAELRTAFTIGQISAPGCTIVNRVGGAHTNAIGYVTIDVVANCNATSPLAPGYFTSEILFDNVLTGDYQHVSPNPATGNYSSGSPLVHIRAVPEGGPAGTFAVTTLPYTFYDLYTTEARWHTQDRRQPLPSTFMPRYIEGRNGYFSTNLLIWREAFVAPALCPVSYASNAYLPLAEVVRFDEHENATLLYKNCGGIPECPPGLPGIPLTSSPSSFNTTIFPTLSTSGDVGGWLYLNLNNGGSRAYSAARNYFGGTTTVGARQSQAWVVTSMYADGRYAVEMDAAAVGNGCSPATDLTTRAHIGPAPNPNP